MSSKQDLALASEQREVLKAFSRVLGQELHVLAQHPELLWQQLYNRLQWEDKEHKDGIVSNIIRPVLNTRTSAGCKPWFHNTCRLREPKSFIRLLQGHTYSINFCVFSPEGGTLATASGDRTVRLWDIRTGATIAVLEGHTKSVNSCVFSPDGRILASASDDKTVRLWDTHRAASEKVLEGHTKEVTSCAFSSDGRTLASASYDNTVRLWDPSTGVLKAVLTGHFCIFFPDGRTLASSSRDNPIRLWDARTGKEIGVLGKTPGVRYFALSPDGFRIAFADFLLYIKLWDILSERYVAELPPSIRMKDFYACVFSPDGRTLASACSDRIVYLYDAHTGKLMDMLFGHTGAVNSCAFSPDGRTLASASFDKTVRLWDINIGLGNEVIDRHINFVKSCVFSPDGHILASASWDHNIRFWDTNTGAQKALLAGHTSVIHSCAFSPDGHTLASTGGSTVRLWDSHSGNDLAVLKGHTKFINFCAFSPDGRTLATASSDKTVRLWDVHTGWALMVLEGHTEDVKSCSFSHRGCTLVSSDWKEVRLWDPNTGSQKAGLPGSGYAFSPDGRTLAVMRGSIIQLWDIRTVVKIAVLDCHTEKVNFCTFSPDGRILAFAGYDNTFQLVDARTGKERVNLIGHNRVVNSCAFSSDGCTLASASYDGTLRLWDARTGVPITTFFCQGDVFVCPFHPYEMRIGTGDKNGNVFILEIIGLEIQPIIVTASLRKRWWKKEFFIRCPACGEKQMVRKVDLGGELICQTPDCGLRLKLNPFVIERS